MITAKELAKEIKRGVEWLIKNDQGCYTIKLDYVLAVCVGWSDGFDPNDETVIHSTTSPTWAITAGIKAWQSDSLRTDFDLINSPYSEEEVFDDDVTISQNENYNELAEYFLKDYKELSEYDIDYDGSILGDAIPSF